MEFDEGIFDESDLLENPTHYLIDALLDTTKEKIDSEMPL